LGLPTGHTGKEKLEQAFEGWRAVYRAGRVNTNEFRDTLTNLILDNVFGENEGEGSVDRTNGMARIWKYATGLNIKVND
jgi:hypothetical protein